MKLIITVEEIEGHCPVHELGDRIVLDDGYRFNLDETTGCCMHSLGAILPFYNALAKGVGPKILGLAHEDDLDGKKAWVQCPDPCQKTGGGTVIFSIEPVE